MKKLLLSAAATALLAFPASAQFHAEDLGLIPPVPGGLTERETIRAGDPRRPVRAPAPTAPTTPPGPATAAQQPAQQPAQQQSEPPPHIPGGLTAGQTIRRGDAPVQAVPGGAVADQPAAAGAPAEGAAGGGAPAEGGPTGVTVGDTQEPQFQERIEDPAHFNMQQLSPADLEGIVVYDMEGGELGKVVEVPAAADVIQGIVFEFQGRRLMLTDADFLVSREGEGPYRVELVIPRATVEAMPEYEGPSTPQ